MGWLDEMFQKGQNRRAFGRIFMMLTMISIGYGNVPKGKKDCQKGQKVVLRCCGDQTRKVKKLINGFIAYLKGKKT
jgi:hypothetical protein